jgi:hypothetical protein
MPQIFYGLPQELVGEVARHARINEQLSLSMVSRTCWYAVGPFIWRLVVGIEHVVRILVHDDKHLRIDGGQGCMLGPDLVCVYPCMRTNINNLQIQFPISRLRVLHFKCVAGWVKILHVYPRRGTHYIWPMAIFNQLQRAVGDGDILPQLRDLYLNREDINGPCEFSLHWALSLLNRNLRSIEFTTNSQFSGLSITHRDTWRLLSEIHGLQIPLRSIALRCPYTEPDMPPLKLMRLTALSLGNLHTLAQISITGSLLNSTLLKSLASLPLLHTLHLVGGPLEEVETTGLRGDEFPALRTLRLYYLDDEQTFYICSIMPLVNHLHEVAIEWDHDTESGFLGINRTVLAIAEHASNIKQLNLRLGTKFSIEKSHCIPDTVWQCLSSRRMEVVTLLGVTLGNKSWRSFPEALVAVWPNLKSLVAPCQVLNPNDLPLILQCARLTHLVHSESELDRSSSTFIF